MNSLQNAIKYQLSYGTTTTTTTTSSSSGSRIGLVGGSSSDNINICTVLKLVRGVLMVTHPHLSAEVMKGQNYTSTHALGLSGLLQGEHLPLLNLVTSSNEGSCSIDNVRGSNSVYVTKQ